MLETTTSPGPACGNACGDVDGDAAHRAFHTLALAGVNARADVEAELSNALDDGASAAHRARGTAERGEEAVACRVDLLSAPAPELLPHHLVMAFEKLAPRSVADRRRAIGGSDDVREHQRREDAVGLWRGPHPRQELLDLVEHRVLIAGVRHACSSARARPPRPGLPLDGTCA